MNMEVKSLGLRQDCFMALIDGVLFKFPTEKEFQEYIKELLYSNK